MMMQGKVWIVRKKTFMTLFAISIDERIAGTSNVGGYMIFIRRKLGISMYI
jgi:hypothetical protein